MTPYNAPNEPKIYRRNPHSDSDQSSDYERPEIKNLMKKKDVIKICVHKELGRSTIFERCF